MTEYSMSRMPLSWEHGWASLVITNDVDETVPCTLPKNSAPKAQGVDKQIPNVEWNCRRGTDLADAVELSRRVHTLHAYARFTGTRSPQAPVVLQINRATLQHVHTSMC